jgi:DNA polymerase-1
VTALSDVSLNLVECIDDAMALKRWLGERRTVLGFDTETDGLRFWDGQCRLAQFGDTETAWAIPFERWGGVVEEVFRTYTGPIVGHNVRFDQRFMHHHGIKVNSSQLHDTMLAAHTLWPDQRLGLKALAVQRLDPAAAAGEHLLQHSMTQGGWTWATVPTELPQYWVYGAIDAVLSARLHELTQPLLDQQGLRHVYGLECAVSEVLFGMETRGARIDVPHCHEQFDLLLKYASDARRYVQDTYGVSPTAKDEVLSYLANQGYTFTETTPTGALKLNEAVLSRIQHPLAQLIVNVRQAEKLANTYFRNFIGLVDDNGMLHCSVRQVGAKTGRMSITDPALQTLPRSNKTVRNAFVPIDADHRIVSIDYSQIEMRIFAHFSGEEEMIRQIRNGVDLHTAVTRTLYSIPDSDDPPSELRQIVKNANFAKVYCAGAAKFAQTAGISEDEGVAFYEAYDRTFPGVRSFQQKIGEVARDRLVREGMAYVRAPSGRLHIANEDSVYKLTNYLVQGTAADVLKQKLVDLYLSGFGEYLVLPIHDEVLFDFPVEHAEELTVEASKIMEDLTSFQVPLVVEASSPLERWTK